MVGLLPAQAFGILGLAPSPLLGLARLACARGRLGRLGFRARRCGLGLARPQIGLTRGYFRRPLGLARAELFLLDLALDRLALVVQAPGVLEGFEVVALGFVQATVNQELPVAACRLLLQEFLGRRLARRGGTLQFGGAAEALLPVGILRGRRRLVGAPRNTSQQPADKQADGFQRSNGGKAASGHNGTTMMKGDQVR